VTKTYRGAALFALAVLLVIPGTALATTGTARHNHVVKGLDWLHTRQRATGGFSYLSTSSSPYDTPWAMLAIAAGNNGPQRWKRAGKNPVNYLQSIDLTSAASTSDNVPKYYALCILAYHAAGRGDLVHSAGSTQIDLVAKLESYATLTSGYFSPVVGSTNRATETTAWAVLALTSENETGAVVNNAVSWLKTDAVIDPTDDQDPLWPSRGGFGLQPATEAHTSYTGLVLQALNAQGVANGDPVVQNAVDFLGRQQRSNAGFVETPGADIAYASTPATSWAAEGLRASGVDPADWVRVDHNGARNDPYGYLIRRQKLNGSFNEYASDIGNVMFATMQSIIGLSTHTLPIRLTQGNDVTRHYDPWFRKGTVLPKNGTKFKVRTVTVKASYRDNTHGTGIRKASVRVRVDGASKTRAATITGSHLSLTLTKLKDGSHTVVFTIADHAGNGAHATRRFTVAVPTPSPSPPPSNTPPGGGNTRPGGGTGGGTVIVPTSRPTTAPSSSATPAQSTPPTANIPGTTLTPMPSATPTFPLTPAPSPSATVAGVVVNGSRGQGGGGSGAAGVAAAIAALVTLACLGAFLVRRHLLDTMSGASRGYVLHEGGSAWQRFWKPAGTPPAPPQE